jgi:hypothetical protein
VYEHLKKIREANNHDWICTPKISAAGVLSISMDWLEVAGVMTDLELSQGQNTLYGDNPLEENGEIVNAVEAVGDASGDGAAPVKYYEDPESRQKYGLRMIRKNFSGITDAGTLLNSAKEFIESSKEANMSTPAIAIQRSIPYATSYIDRTFSKIRLGNIAKKTNTDVGFSAGGLGSEKDVRIQGYRFDESAGTCELMLGKVKNGS